MGYNHNLEKGALPVFQQIFNSENGFFVTVGKIMDVVGLSVVWLVFCLPVVTIGPATAALYYSAVKCVRRGRERPYRNFLNSFRANWRQGVLLTLICLPVAAFLLWEHRALGGLAAGGDQIVLGAYFTLTALLLLPIGFLCWLFPLLSRFESSLGGLLWSALQLTFRHLPSTILLALLVFVSATASAAFWFFVPFAVTPAVTALLASLLVERVLKKLTPGQELQEGEEKPWYL